VKSTARMQGTPHLGQTDQMCRNITILRGLEPAASAEEIEASARQYVRKVSGIRQPSANTSEVFERAVADIADITQRLLTDLPPRKQPPTSVPPMRLHGRA